LQDHLFSLVGPFVFNEGVKESLHPIRDSTLEGLIRYTSNGTGPLASISTISSVGFINTNSSTPAASKGSADWPDIQFFQMGFGIPKGIGAACAHLANIQPTMVEDYVSGIVGRDSNTIIQVLVRPKSRGWIGLKGESPFLKPIIQPNYFSNKQDLTAMVEGRRIFNRKQFHSELLFNWLINEYSRIGYRYEVCG